MVKKIGKTMLVCGAVSLAAGIFCTDLTENFLLIAGIVMLTGCLLVNKTEKKKRKSPY